MRGEEPHPTRGETVCAKHGGSRGVNLELKSHYWQQGSGRMTLAEELLSQYGNMDKIYPPSISKHLKFSAALLLLRLIGYKTTSHLDLLYARETKLERANFKKIKLLWPKRAKTNQNELI